ncbi:SRPBCC domain-containing protein [Aeoliella sp. ICT_H6.2]|uniref:SRPBCC domain-containing protein n=1 Tax=Aeoliella straminimaris TaxID=2954799 RepID=A0A9X2FGH8_9BACT|nr:SRPBCC domain-containing protein [Aeoliella straminimaris]MCO6045231.1 SRPBCC domain-containing protein [Aeoliella straminimaris]
MAFGDNTPPSQSHTISLEVELSHPPEKVWRALTQPELLKQWLLPVCDLQLDPGATFKFQAPPQPGWDGTVDCELLEIQESRKMTFTWVVGDMETVVTFTLSPTDSGTRLQLVHSGFKPEQKKNFAGARYGWNLMGGRLVELLTQIS